VIALGMRFDDFSRDRQSEDRTSAPPRRFNVTIDSAELKQELRRTLAWRLPRISA